MDFTIPDDLNMYDAEVQKCLKILGFLQVKYSQRKASFENLVSLSNEAMDMFEKAGFIATVSVFDDSGNPKLPPEITIHGRVDPKEFDPDRQQWEVKKEVAQDDVVKEFLAKGGTADQKTEVTAEVTEPEKE